MKKHERIACHIGDMLASEFHKLDDVFKPNSYFVAAVPLVDDGCFIEWWYQTYINKGVMRHDGRTIKIVQRIRSYFPQSYFYSMHDKNKYLVCRVRYEGIFTVRYDYDSQTDSYKQYNFGYDGQ
jgi:hypothetical protein